MTTPQFSNFQDEIHGVTLTSLTGVDNSIPFEIPSNVLVVGPTGAGKSVLVNRIILERSRLYREKIHEILVFYETWTENLQILKDSIDEISFYTEIPTINELKTRCSDGKNRIIFFDDKLPDLPKHYNLFLWIFTSGNSKCRFSVLMSTQNIFYSSKGFRDLSLNAGYFVFLKSKRAEGQLYCFANQIFLHKSKFFMDAYRKACIENYSYLLVDLHPKSNDLFKLRTKIFYNENCVVFTENAKL